MKSPRVEKFLPPAASPLASLGWSAGRKSLSPDFLTTLKCVSGRRNAIEVYTTGSENIFLKSKEGDD
ncbi:hypothetical protein JTE90_004205 [Oedothorax gibbosus]|uniref:Uncharacterized protein n=1 Tax=Oedothorax gibbosus TaxID=931172 RepID=A0AAV6V2T7_9ARAC|nr:hypothetical protein JTE90_004205 [Oedothorax gibbosus]